MMDRDDLDRRLSAWLDGALSDAEAAEFEQEVERNRALAERAANWRENDRLIADTLSPVANEPIDQEMLFRLGLAEGAGTNAAANDNLPWWRQRWLPVGGAIAASVVAALALMQHPQRGVSDGGLSAALDRTPALQAAMLSDGTSITPILTAKAEDGRWCREYRIGGRAGLACRDRDGWKVEAESSAAGEVNTGEIGLAAGEADAAIDSANENLKMSDPIDALEEKSLIAKGWSSR